MAPVKYRPRVVDSQLSLRMEAFGAVQIVGPKGCGKTTTAKQQARTVIEFQDEDNRDRYLQIAEERPSRLLRGEKPVLFDEWQDAPKIWGAVRKDVDDTGLNGQYILTGSSSRRTPVPHTGTMRISTLRMLPMSLYESGESNGQASLSDLFNGVRPSDGWASELDFDDLVFAICRGGWPKAINNPTRGSKLLVAEDLIQQTCHVDISNIDGVSRNPEWTRRILRSYSRNICQLADRASIYADVSAEGGMSEPTFYDYVDALERLHMICDINAWNPAIRSRTAIRSKTKKNLVDPSLAVASLGLSPEYFDRDFNTLGFLFESLVMRDLQVYSSAAGGSLSYYHDRYDLEADAVLHLKDGRYAVIEVKLGQKGISDGARNLNRIESLIEEKNQGYGPKIRPPDLKIVITGTEEGYKRDDGVLIVPVGCLKPRRATAHRSHDPPHSWNFPLHPLARRIRDPGSGNRLPFQRIKAMAAAEMVRESLSSSGSPRPPARNLNPSGDRSAAYPVCIPVSSRVMNRFQSLIDSNRL